MQFRRHSARCAGLLPWEPVIADESRFARLAEIEDLGHPARAPIRQTRNEECNSRIALPETLMGITEAAHHNSHSNGLRRIGDVPDLMGGVAVGTQQIDLALIRARQLSAVAYPRHLGTAGFTSPRRGHLPRNMRKIFRL